MNSQKLLCIALFGIIAGTALIPVAYAERGYFAVGGEWVLIIVAAVLTAKCFQRKEDT